MLLLAGLIGMVAVSTAAVWGMEDLGNDNARDDVSPPGDTDLPAFPSGAASLLDLAADDDGTGDDPEGDDYGVIQGTRTADALSGTDRPEFIDGLGGDDTLSTGDGDDIARGGAGDDDLSGGAGDDTLHGGSGADTVTGDDGSDSVLGHDGDDLLSGGAGDDSLVGGEGQDSLSGDGGNDALHGYLGDDSLDGGAGKDTLFGGHGNDTLSGLAPDGADPAGDIDYLNGGAGDDVIRLGASDIATGGTGADSFILRDWLGADHQARIVDFNSAEDRLVVLCDDTGNAVPDVTIEQDTDAVDLHRVLLDGKVIAEVTSDTALTLDHVTIIPQTTG